ncbi:hypothetical protein SBOR_4026 [Sclerotinia borealis F-4128]|uniref:RRM domain-containing protein n=1 Tax=Sclerotinia borealis (strain F-4128) TaxID=1432307 RepID=W9CLQ3_SCLBF|nr:hypothetical protein SBOR_4026 [Sclerotinia borealis F-4128]
MNRGGKLAPEVNRYVPSFVVHCTCTTGRSFVRQESKVCGLMQEREDVGTWRWGCGLGFGVAGNEIDVHRHRADGSRNDSYNVTPEELFDLFGKFGAIRQIRQGIATNTKGTAFVVYEDVTDSKTACDKLNGFNFQNRYLVVLYHQPEKMEKMRANSNQSDSYAARKAIRPNAVSNTKSTASMGPSSRVGNGSPVEEVRKDETRRQSASITTRKSPTTTAMHGKGDKYQHVEHHRGIRGAAVAGGRRNTSFLALVRGLVFRR